MQDTFLRYFKNPPAAPDGIESLAPWLFTVCRRLIIDHQRKNQRIVPMTAAVLSFHEALDEPSPGPAAALEEKEDHSRLRGLIKTLPERQRELVRLKFESGLSYRDIAAATGLSITNVGTLLHQAVQTLREQFHAV